MGQCEKESVAGGGVFGNRDWVFGRVEVDFFIANLILWGRVKHVLSREDRNFRRWLA